MAALLVPVIAYAQEGQVPIPQAEPAPPERPKNPLSNLLGKIFGPSRPENGEAADSEPGRGNGWQSRMADQVDRSAPQDPEQIKLLSQARTRLKAGETREATELLQRILDQPQDSLVRRPDGEWVPAHQEANALLKQLPPAELENYRLRYGDQALALYRDALKTGDPARLAAVATRFLHTDAGREAANLLGSYHFDRGEFGMAARWFAQLLDSDHALTRDPLWKLKAAFAFKRAGRSELAEALVKDLPPDVIANGVSVGQRRIAVDDWLQRADRLADSHEPPLDEWRMLFGSPSRTGVASGGEPLLLPRWTLPTAHSQSIYERTGMLVEDLADEGRVPILAWFPLLVDGKVIFRTLRGVQVADAQTGRPLWETGDELAPEQLLSGDFASSGRARRRQMMWFRGAFQWQFDEEPHDQHPLTNLLFRNGAYGVLSSDGAQVFVLEDQPVVGGSNYDPRFGVQTDEEDPLNRDWSSNTITSYDLATGRPLWSIGGREMLEPFDRPLAGTYFFGAPVPDGGELLIMGEKNNEIRLYALDPASGEPLWSQLAAVSPTKIELDFGRRLWSAQPSVRDGIVVCPTTVGWLVAVDRVKHTVLWAHRYSEPQPDIPDPYEVQTIEMEELNGRWGPSSPILTESKVVYTPSEEPLLVCVNALDGHRIWQVAKEDSLYLGGVFGNRVVVVGKFGVTALSLDDGTVVWSMAFPPGGGPPSGTGVAVDGKFYVPLRAGELCAIDLETGNVASEAYLRDTMRPLGNLAMYQGMLVSLSPFEVTAFEQRGSIESEIQNGESDGAHGIWARLRQADIHLLNRKYPEALNLLRQIEPSQITDAASRSRYHRAKLESLAAIVRSDFASHEKEVEELGAIAETPAEKLLYRRLQAERLESIGDAGGAFRKYVELGLEPDGGSIQREDGSRVTVAVSSWVAGKLGDLWGRMSPAMQDEATRRVEEAAAGLAANDRAAQERFVELFDFHPAALRVRKELVESYAADKNLVASERHLLHLVEHADATSAATNAARLARLYLEMGHPADAAPWADLLERRFAGLALEDGSQVEAVVAELRGKGAAGDSGRSDAHWPEGPLKLVQVGGSPLSESLQELSFEGHVAPFFQNHRFEVDFQTDRLAVYDAADGSLQWLASLRQNPRSKQDTYAVAAAAGHLLLVLHRDVLHAFSPATQEPLWSRPLEVRGASFGSYRAPEPVLVEPLQDLESIRSGDPATRQAMRGGMLAFANTRYVGVHGRRTFSVLDAATGEELWERREVGPQTVVLGTCGIVLFVPPDGGAAVCLRMSDGKPLEMPDAAELLSRTLFVLPEGLVLADETSGQEGAEQTIIRLYDPAAHKDRWRVELPAGVRIGGQDEGWMPALDPAGKLLLVDLATGATQTFAEGLDNRKPEAGEVFVLQDDGRVYAAVGSQLAAGRYEFGEIVSIPSAEAVYGFDRRTGQRLWKAKVDGMQLIYQRLRSSPVLVFAERDYRQQGDIHQGWIQLMCISKRTGQRLLATELPINASFHALTVDLRGGFVELASYDQRLRLMPQ